MCAVMRNKISTWNGQNNSTIIFISRQDLQSQYYFVTTYLNGFNMVCPTCVSVFIKDCTVYSFHAIIFSKYFVCIKKTSNIS